MILENYIRDIENFPKEGIIFKDITPLLGNAKASQLCLDKLMGLVPEVRIDKVVGIESRGFFFANLLAQKLNAGFVPIRKPGKLPFNTFCKSYALEYGTDSIEMHIDAIQKGENVLLHDDVLATGGTAKAACELIEMAGGHIVQCNFLMELAFLKGRNLISNYDVRAVLTY